MLPDSGTVLADSQSQMAQRVEHPNPFDGDDDVDRRAERLAATQDSFAKAADELMITHVRPVTKPMIKVEDTAQTTVNNTTKPTAHKQPSVQDHPEGTIQPTTAAQTTVPSAPTQPIDIDAIAERLRLATQDIDLELEVAMLESKIREKQVRLEQLRRRNGTSAADMEDFGSTSHSRRSTTANVRLPNISLPKYKGETYSALTSFLHDCESLFDMHPDLPDVTKIATAGASLVGHVKSGWITHRRDLNRQHGGSFTPTWKEFVAFLEDSIADSESRGLEASMKGATLQQKPGQSVQAFMGEFYDLESQLGYTRTDRQRRDDVLWRLLPEISQAITNQYTIPPDIKSLVGLARRIEGISKDKGTLSTPARRQPVAQPTPEPATVSSPAQTHVERPRPAQSVSPTKKPVGQCHRCNEYGHYASACTALAPAQTNSQGYGAQTKTCKICKQEGHVAAQCHLAECGHCRRDGRPYVGHTTLACPHMVAISNSNSVPLGNAAPARVNHTA